MGTNYYVVRNRPSIEGAFHIGKSSAGWLFCFQYQNEIWNDPPVVWSNFDEVKAWLEKYVVDKKEYVIMNEYDEIIPYEQFIGIVEAKQKDQWCKNNKDNFQYSDNQNGYRFSHGDFS